MAVAVPTENVARASCARADAAHSSPIYVEMRGHPLEARADAEYFLKWIDRLEADVTRRDRVPTGLDHVKMQFDAARAVYRKLAQ